MASSSSEEQKTIPLKILIDKQNNKVIAIESTKHFIDTLFSFLSLPLATIIRLINHNESVSSETESVSILGSIKNLYQSVQTLTLNDVWNPICKQMLLHPQNPCESLCSNLFLNIDDTESTKFYVCDYCYKFTTFRDLVCSCGKGTNKQPMNLDSEGSTSSNTQGNDGDGVFVKENGSLFLVFDDLKIVPSSLVTSMQVLMELGYSDLSQLEEQTRNIGKQEIVFAEASEDFVDFMFSFLSIPLGSIVKLLDGNSFVGCVDNLYKSVETLDSSWCTGSRSVLLNPGVAPQFGCPKQLLGLPDLKRKPPSYYYGTEILEEYRDHYGYTRKIEVTTVGGVISKYQESIYNAKRLAALDPRSPNRSKNGVVGFVKRPALYAVGDDLTVKPLSAGSCLSYLKELSLPLTDLEVKEISIGGAEALSLLGASLTSKFTLTSGLEEFFNVPKQESNLTSKYTYTSRLDELSKDLKPET